MRTYFDALILGAGPAGSTAAILLAQAGWSVALLEKQVFPRRKVCGECIAASNLPLFDALGVGEAFAAMAGPGLRHVAIMTGAGSIQAPLPPLPCSPQRWGRALGREHLDALLRDRARQAGASILQPWIAHAVNGGPGAFRCEAGMAGTHERVRLHAPLLIAAHGSWQPAPGVPYARAASRAGDLFAFKANFNGAGLSPGLLPVLAFSGGYGGMVIGEDGVMTLAACIRRDKLSALRRAMPGISAGEAVEAYLQHSIEGVRQALAPAERRGKWLSAGPIRPGVRIETQSRSGVFLIGNAAGEAHPIIGEGISMAMQSAWLLCSRLLAHGEKARTNGCASMQQEIARDYASAWLRQFRPRIRMAALFAHLAMRPAAALLLPLLQRTPGLLTDAARFCGKVTRPDGLDGLPTHAAPMQQGWPQC